MNKINNVESINKIIMKPQATCLCQIGQDWYLNNFTVEFYPNDYYPDYMEVEAWIKLNDPRSWLTDTTMPTWPILRTLPRLPKKTRSPF